MKPSDARSPGPKLVIALYRPHAGQDEALRKLIAEHMPILRRLGLVTDRPTVLMHSEDGTYLEVLEWRSPDSAIKAEQHPEVAKVWEAMAKIADLPTLNTLPESNRHFAYFEPVSL